MEETRLDILMDDLVVSRMLDGLDMLVSRMLVGLDGVDGVASTGASAAGTGIIASGIIAIG